jgi:hypothetical protein
VDGTNCLSSSFLVCLINILFDPCIFKENSNRLYIQQQMPWAISFGKETINVVNNMRYKFGKLIRRLLCPFQYHKYNITFKLRKSKADNSCLAKVWGNSVGGHFRCCFCSSNWNENIISYSYCCQQQEKTLEFIMNSVKEKTGSQFGISFLPGILLDDCKTSLSERGLDMYEKSHDRLHNTKGHMYNMYKQFERESGFDKIQALNNLKDFVGRDSFQEDMKGADWRFFFVLYEQTLLPCISFQRESAISIIQTWLEIQFICYQSM